MKVYIISDIEGSCGFTHIDEGNAGTRLYDYFANQMTKESCAAASSALSNGANYVLIHDAHGSARNIDPTKLPVGAELLRQSGGDPYAMLSGAQEGDFDAVFMTGFHSGAGCDGSPVSHTFNRQTVELFLNGERLSEFLYDVYSAVSLSLPVPFVSGDKKICEMAKKLIPNITAVETVKGFGAGTISKNPDLAVKEISDGVKKALDGDWKSCKIDLPDHFKLTVRYNRHQDARYNSFYPGVKQVDDCTIEFNSDTWFEILRAIHFILK